MAIFDPKGAFQLFNVSIKELRMAFCINVNFSNHIFFIRILFLNYDETVYPPLESVPKRYAISRRNEWMVCESDGVVAYVMRGFGGAAKTLDYARRKKKAIICYEHSPGSSARAT